MTVEELNKTTNKVLETFEKDFELSDREIALAKLLATQLKYEIYVNFNN